MSAHPAKWTSGSPTSIPRSLRKGPFFTQDDTPVTAIDNPPPFNAADCQSTLGRAVNNLRHGRRIAYDDAQDLMDQGFDLHAIEAGYNRFAE